jgi:hypothetical protein
MQSTEINLGVSNSRVFDGKSPEYEMKLNIYIDDAVPDNGW